MIKEVIHPIGAFGLKCLNFILPFFLHAYESENSKR